MMYAAEQGHYQLVEYFISLGGNVDFDCQMFYPLMACFNKAFLEHENVSLKATLFKYHNSVS